MVHMYQISYILYKDFVLVQPTFSPDSLSSNWGTNSILSKIRACSDSCKASLMTEISLSLVFSAARAKSDKMLLKHYIYIITFLNRENIEYALF